MLVQVPHPLYRPTKSKLVPCVDPLCASLHGGLTGRHKCDSPHQQCDYEIRYADQGSSIGVLVNDSFAVRLANTSVVHPSLAFGYATCILRSVYNFEKSTSSNFPVVGFICTGVDMTNMLAVAVMWHPLTEFLGLEVDQLVCSRSSRSMGSPRMLLATASV